MTPELEVIAKQTKEELIYHLSNLPEIYQQILYLFYFKELSQKEIHQYLNINIPTVKTRLFRAKSQLKSSMVLH